MRQPSIALLNVGEGDTKLTFDKKNMAETIRAARIVKDMLRRGYTLIIEPEPGKFAKVKEFREDVCEYIIADMDPVVAAVADRDEILIGGRDEIIIEGRANEQESSEAETAAAAHQPAPAARGRKPGKTKRVTAYGTKGTAVAPTAGG